MAKLRNIGEAYTGYEWMFLETCSLFLLTFNSNKCPLHKQYKLHEWQRSEQPNEWKANERPNITQTNPKDNDRIQPTNLSEI